MAKSFSLAIYLCKFQQATLCMTNDGCVGLWATFCFRALQQCGDLGILFFLSPAVLNPSTTMSLIQLLYITNYTQALQKSPPSVRVPLPRNIMVYGNVFELDQSIKWPVLFLCGEAFVTQCM
jgi:hypothetical protein